MGRGKERNSEWESKDRSKRDNGRDYQMGERETVCERREEW
jgi:hypothetical protein